MMNSKTQNKDKPFNLVLGGKTEAQRLGFLKELFPLNYWERQEEDIDAQTREERDETLQSCIRRED